MKQILLLLTLFIGLQTVNAQYVMIPDSTFRIYLKSQYPTCFNGSDMMDTTCSVLLNVHALGLSNMQIASIEGLQYFKNLQYLDCSLNQLTELPSLPNTLNNLLCNHNRLTVLPSLPSSLTSMYCPSNQLATLPSLPNTLTLLDCVANHLIVLPSLPNSLQLLDCSSNQLTVLPSLPSSLETINCYLNQLTVLPPLPSGLNKLDCHLNQLTVLPSLPNSIKEINCYYNQLAVLPALPSGLISFYCDYNQLTELQTLPSSLINLGCSGNQLSVLPSLPNSLQVLLCSSNALTALPSLPNTVFSLNCSKNQLTALPSLPNLLEQLNCTTNPLSCLPILPFNVTLSVKETNVSCLPNAIASGHSDTILPICTNASDICAVNPFVQGNIYNDANNNGIYNNGEELLSQQIVKVLPNNWLGVSDANGNYLVKLDTAISNTWSVVNNYRYVTITPASYSLANIHNLGLQSGSYDFGVHLIANVKDLETTLGSSPARPGFTTNVTITTNNIGTVNQSNITIKLKKPNGFDVLATSISPTFTINDTLIWNNISIDYLEHQSIDIQLQVPIDAVLGDSAVYEAWSNGTEGDTIPLDNYATWTEVIRGSFDPNDKLVNPSTLPPTYNADTDRLLYTIRFQNTGTDTAFTVIVRDEIPNNLDVSSLRVVNASHKYQLIVREKNIVEVAFSNIQLPDSNTNEAKSHGFVQLEFKPKAGLPANADINNTASIFFDYNLPVITNTATTKIQLILGTASNKKLAFKLFPNPTSSSIKIELPYIGNGNWYLTDISGNRIKQNSIENNTDAFDINVADVASGTYLLTLEMNGTVSTSKVVIVR